MKVVEWIGTALFCVGVPGVCVLALLWGLGTL